MAEDKKPTEKKDEKPQAAPTTAPTPPQPQATAPTPAPAPAAPTTQPAPSRSLLTLRARKGGVEKTVVLCDAHRAEAMTDHMVVTSEPESKDPCVECSGAGKSN